MSDTFFLIPKPGVQVRDPITAEPLPPTGAEKQKTAYWFRRLRDADVTAGTTREPRAAESLAEAPVRVAPKNKPTKE